MKNLIRASIVVGFVLLQGCTPSASSTSVTSSATSPKLTKNSVGGSDRYEVLWIGTKGKKLYGSYVVASTQKTEAPIRVESINAQLPHKISFSAPKNSIVSASGGTLDKGPVEVKIYKNGSECGKATFVGSGVGANKTCQ